MKKILYTLITLFIAIGLSNCTTETDPVEDKTNEIKDTTQIVENESGEVIQIDLNENVDAKEAVEDALYSGGKNLMGETKNEVKDATKELNIEKSIFGEWTLVTMKSNGTELPVEALYTGYTLDFIEPETLKRTISDMVERFKFKIKDDQILDVENGGTQIYKVLNVKDNQLLIQEDGDSGVNQFLFNKVTQ